MTGETQKQFKTCRGDKERGMKSEGYKISENSENMLNETSQLKHTKSESHMYRADFGSEHPQ